MVVVGGGGGLFSGGGLVGGKSRACWWSLRFPPFFSDRKNEKWQLLGSSDIKLIRYAR